MEGIQTFVQFFLDLGASVFLPVVIFILALIFGAKPGKAIRSALMIGVGFIGIGVVLGILFDNLGPASNAMVERFGLNLNIIDVGWPAAAAIAFGSDIAALIIPAAILLNLVLLFTRVTKTINIDIWNYWHFAFAGAMVQAITGNIWLGLISAMIFASIILFLADWTGPATQQLMGMPNVSLPHGFSTAFVVPAMLVNKIIDLIPGLNKLKADPDSIKKRFGVFGEPILQGVVIGIVIALIAYAGNGKFTEWITKVLQVGISLAADAPYGGSSDGRIDSAFGSCPRIPAETGGEPGNLHWSGFGHCHWSSDIHCHISGYGAHYTASCGYSSGK